MLRKWLSQALYGFGDLTGSLGWRPLMPTNGALDIAWGGRLGTLAPYQRNVGNAWNPHVWAGVPEQLGSNYATRLLEGISAPITRDLSD